MWSMCTNWSRQKNHVRKPCRNCVLAEQAERAAQNALTGADQPPAEERRRSLPRRLLGRFESERSINDEAEELKQYLKAKGMYNRNQTLDQRRRMKELLEYKHRSFLADDGPTTSRDGSNTAPVVQMVSSETGHSRSLTMLPPRNSLYASGDALSNSVPEGLQKPSVTPIQPGNQTTEPDSSLPYRETDV